MDRGALGGLNRSASEHPHRHGRPRRPGSGRPDRLEVLTRLAGHQPDRGELAHSSLARPHRYGRAALAQLDRVVALLDAAVDVLGRDVLAEAGERLAATVTTRSGWRERLDSYLALIEPLAEVEAPGGGAVFAEPERVGGLAPGDLARYLRKLVGALAGHLT